MAQIVSNIQNQPPVVGSPLPGGPLIDSFIVRRPVEGLQIVIEYVISSSSITELKVMRKQFSYPINLTDGLEVLSVTNPTTNFFVDENIDEGVVYYYKAFAKDTNNVWWTDNKWQGYAFNCKTGFFRQKLYDLLPQIYRTEDRKNRTFALEKQVSTLLKENIHIPETGELKYELQRFLYLFATFLDEAKCLIDFVPTLYDVDTAPPLTLEHIASIVGVVFNYELPIDRQRIEIREAVNNYKLKGTLQGIISHVQKITGFATQVKEMVKNVIILNRGDKTFFNPVVSTSDLLGTINDPSSRFLEVNGLYSTEVIWIDIVIPEGKELTSNVASKLIRTLRDWLPADTVGHIRFNDFLNDSMSSAQPFSDVYSDSTIEKFLSQFNTLGNVWNHASYVFGF